MKRFIDAGASNKQWDEVVDNAIDKRQFVDITTPLTPDDEFSIEHGFGTPALGFIVISTDKAGSVYNSGTVWDDNKIYLRASAATMALRVLVF